MRLRPYVDSDWPHLCRIHDAARMDELRASALEAAFLGLASTAAEFMAWKRHLARRLEKRLRAEDHAVFWPLDFNDPDGKPHEITTYEYEAVAQFLRDEPSLFRATCRRSLSC